MRLNAPAQVCLLSAPPTRQISRGSRTQISCRKTTVPGSLMGTGHSCRSVRPAETDTVSCADLKTLRSATVGVDDVDAH